MNTTFFALRSSRRTAVLKMKVALCVLYYYLHVSVSILSLCSNYNMLPFSMIFVRCSLEKLIPNTVPREKKRQQSFRVILFETPGDLADSGK